MQTHSLQTDDENSSIETTLNKLGNRFIEGKSTSNYAKTDAILKPTGNTNLFYFVTSEGWYYITATKA